MCNQVAAMSGDARRVLEICRRAAELADYRLKQCLQSTRHSYSVSNSAKGIWTCGTWESSLRKRVLDVYKLLNLASVLNQLFV